MSAFYHSVPDSGEVLSCSLRHCARHAATLRRLPTIPQPTSRWRDAMAGFFLGNNGSGGYLAITAPFNGTVDAFVHARTMYVVFPENGPHGMTVLRVTDPDGNDLYKRDLFGDGVTII